MAKFGLFDSAHHKPLQEYDGDEMQQNGDHVYIYKDEPGGKRRQVAAISLNKGQSVKEIAVESRVR